MTEPTARDLRERAALAAADAAESTRQARLLQEQARAIERAEEAAKRPQQPAIGGTGDRAVVAFTKYMSGREYNYAALGWRVGRSIRWAVTGTEERRFNWPALLDFVGAANWPSMVLMIDGDSLMPPGVEAVAVERIGPFGRVTPEPSTTDVDYGGW